MKHLPFALIQFRLLIALLFFYHSLYSPILNKRMVVGLILLGFLSDIFDGIIARYLGVATVSLRKWDSRVDRLFWIGIVAITYAMSPICFYQILPFVGLLLFFDFLSYVISFTRFQKEPAPHSYLSKLFGIGLLMGFLFILTKDNANVFIYWITPLGLLSRIEVILIYLILPEWKSDVPGIRQAIRFRQGKEIQRFKMFN